MAHITSQAAVLLTAPELAAITDANRWEQVLSDVDLEIADPSFFGAQTEYAARQLAAHWMTVRGRGLQTGSLQSITVGPMTKTFARPAGGIPVPERFSGSSYGIEYWRLVRIYGAGPVLVQS